MKKKLQQKKISKPSINFFKKCKYMHVVKVVFIDAKMILLYDGQFGKI